MSCDLHDVDASSAALIIIMHFFLSPVFRHLANPNGARSRFLFEVRYLSFLLVYLDE